MAEAPSNTHNKRSLIRTCMYVTDFLQSEETSKWKRINTHTRARAHTLTHTHTHTHTRIHTHAYTYKQQNKILQTIDVHNILSPSDG